MARSIAFYRVLFGVEPAKHHPDYAKFEIDEPPAVFSLTPNNVGRGGVMSHMGLRLTNEADVRKVQRRLETAGIRTREQNDMRGCYAVQEKVWVEDPDLNLWEIYIVREDIFRGDVSGSRALPPEPVSDDGPDRHVLYKGPFRELTDDVGRVFPRGETVAVPPRIWESLRQGPTAAQFVFSIPAASAGCH
ncbi:ArsI/CadI family heavy metal resistance metalloenzyme [Zavarzinella formosa]|uniref:ArsI/CadI family heavy metal resistance metalloenzyme n=1 Tax=Zavarzinella formosa TaxID=360055 RepID=UPI0002D47022|nr:ArsI/CadI family heavy metal resistance metalloenzyme [Zavarzinella formosa]